METAAIDVKDSEACKLHHSPARAMVDLDSMVLAIEDELRLLKPAVAGFSLFNRLFECSSSDQSLKSDGRAPGPPLLKCGAPIGTTSIEVITDMKPMSPEERAQVSHVFRVQHAKQIVQRAEAIVELATQFSQLFTPREPA